MSEELGCEIWLKRDDAQPPALVGNKLRKFELVIGRAQAEGRDTLVTTGALQSNSARVGAAAAAAVGMRSVLVLSGQEPEPVSANLLIDHLVGADVRYAGDVDWNYLNTAVNDIVSELHRKERKPFSAPVGCSSPLGSLGFALAFLELHQQLQITGLEPSAIVHTSTSGGTHAGLLVGRAVADSDVDIIAVDVGAIYSDPAASIAGLAHEAASLIDFDLKLAPEDLRITTDQLGPGYAVPTEAGNEAVRLMARTEAILLDPVYSGKGFGGLVSMIRSGELEGPVVFWHTGGQVALFDPEFAAPFQP